MRLLLIAPKFFGYEEEIRSELRMAGWNVDLYDERPSSAALVKVGIRVRPELFRALSRAHVKRIIRETANGEYAVVFVIKAEGMSPSDLAALRAAHPAARFVYYAWDSLKNIRNSLRKLAYFDRAYSFDRFDCSAFEGISHLPLFYGRAYEDVGMSRLSEGTGQDLDLLFLGSIHSDRYPVVQNIARAAKDAIPELTVHTHWFYQSKLVFGLRKLFDSNFRSIPRDTVQWQALDRSDALALIRRARMLIDVHHAGQTGLTMRTMESLGARIKLITTNADVVNYEFYTPDNILVVDRIDPIIPKSFLTSPYRPVRPAVYERYSLRSWLGQILS